MTILVPFDVAFDDPQLLGPHGPSFDRWRTVAKVMDGRPLTEDEADLFRRSTGRTVVPTVPAAETWLVMRRRDGKTYFKSRRAAWKATCVDHRPYLSPGEWGVVLCVAADRRQGKILRDYIGGALHASPVLRKFITGETRETIELEELRIRIEVRPPNYRLLRGVTIVEAYVDEINSLPTDDSALPDTEALAAIRPGGASIPSFALTIGGSPYAKRGEQWRAVQRYFGQDDPRVLVWWARGPDLALNPTVSERVIADAYERDSVSAASEWGAEYRSDISSFIDMETLRSVVVPGRESLPRPHGVQEVAFTDVAGGAGKDSWATAWGYAHNGRAIVSGLLEFTPPFSPEASAKILCDTLKARGIRSVTGDRFGGLWPVEMLRRFGVIYTEAEQPRSQLYLEALPIITAQRCELLDHPKMLRQFSMLERRTGRSGKDAVDHPGRGGGVSGHHDDLSNSVAGLLVQLSRPVATIGFLKSRC